MIISSPPSKRFAIVLSSFSKTSDGGIIQDIKREELIKKENMTRCERKENERRMRKKKKNNRITKVKTQISGKILKEKKEKE